MNTTTSLARYDTRVLFTVAGLLLAMLVLRLLVLPLAVVTVLLDRTQAHLSTVAAEMPTRSSAPEPADVYGGDLR